MHKERQVLPVTSNRNRVSPYPLRSCRSKKQKEAESSSPLVSESSSVSEWEDVRCVICMEPPHNAVLLQCSSFSKGCRAYMCDTSSRHSNCFKQYRSNNNNKNSTSKIPNCPYCRGEVHGTTKSTPARRFMNARPRCCAMAKCHFTGTYSQLKTHVKAEHADYIAPMLGTWVLRRDRETQFVETLNALRGWEVEERPLMPDPLYQLPPHHHHPSIHLSFDAFINRFDAFINRFTGESRQGNATSYPHGTMYPGWTP